MLAICETCAAWGLSLKGDRHDNPALDEIVSSCHNPRGMGGNLDHSEWCTEWRARNPGPCGDCKWWDWEGSQREAEWMARGESPDQAREDTEDAKHKGACLKHSPGGAYWFPATLKDQRGCGDFWPKEGESAKPEVDTTDIDRALSMDCNRWLAWPIQQAIGKMHRAESDMESEGE